MPTRIKCLLVMLLFSLIGFGPLSLTCLIGIYVVLVRPAWFIRVARNLYLRPNVSVKSENMPSVPAGNFLVRGKAFINLVMLLILDIAPLPIAGIIGLTVVLFRPVWFIELVEQIYAH